MAGDPPAHRGVNPRLVRKPVAQAPRGLNFNEGLLESKARARRPQRAACGDPHFPVMRADAGLRIAGIAPLAAVRIAAKQADGVALVAPDLPGHADFDRTAPLIVDEGVFPVLPVRLQLQGQAIRDAVFGEQTQRGVAAIRRQRALVSVRVEAGVGAQILIFDDGLGAALWLCPGAGGRAFRRRR